MTSIRLMLICFSCVQASLTAPKETVRGGSNGRAQLDALLSRFWSWRLQESPEYAAKYEIPLYQDRVEQFTEEAFLGQKNNASEFLQELEAINRSSLNRENRTSVDILKYSLTTFIDGFKFRKFGMYNPLNVMEDPLKSWVSLLSWTRPKLKTIADYDNLFARYRALPVQVDQIIDMMGKAIVARTTRHMVTLTGVIERIKKEASALRTNVSLSSFYQPLRQIADVIPTSMRESITNEGKRLLKDSVGPAWIKLKDFMTREYIRNSAPHYGVGRLSGGQEYYQAALKWHTSLDLTPQQVHELGLSEVARIYKLIQQEMLKDGFSGTLPQYKEHLRTAKENFYETEDEMWQGYRDILDAARDRLPLVIKSIPKTRCRVWMSNSRYSINGRYFSPSPDRVRPGTFVANVFNPDTKPKYNMVPLALHEAEPGHHVMASYYLERGSLPLFRGQAEYRRYFAAPFNWPFFTAYSEGWALYAESLGEEMGLYDQPHARLGRYSSEMFRACRLVVDTGIHALGWTQEQAVNYMLNYTTRSRTNVEFEVKRYISWPGQSCSYKIGELKIKELRKRAEERLGAQFDLREFHDQVLKLGPSPLSILDTHIEDWLQAPVTRSNSSPVPASPSLLLLLLLFLAATNCEWTGRLVIFV